MSTVQLDWRQRYFSQHRQVICDQKMLESIKKTDKHQTTFHFIFSLFERFKYWFLGVNTQEYTLPLKVLTSAEQSGAKPTLSACKTAMEKFNRLPLKKSYGSQPPKIIHTELKEGPIWNSYMSHSFVMRFYSANESHKDVPLCTIDSREDEKVALALKHKLSHPPTMTKRKVNYSGFLVQQAGGEGCFKDGSAAYRDLDALMSSENEHEADEIILRLQFNCLDPRVRFKVTINQPDPVLSQRCKNYWIVFSTHSPMCLRWKLPTKDVEVDTLYCDREDCYLKELKEPTQKTDIEQDECGLSFSSLSAHFWRP